MTVKNNNTALLGVVVGLFVAVGYLAPVGHWQRLRPTGGR
jgi:hypothetical protein